MAEYSAFLLTELDRQEEGGIKRQIDRQTDRQKDKIQNFNFRKMS